MKLNPELHIFTIHLLVEVYIVEMTVVHGRLVIRPLCHILDKVHLKHKKHFK